LNLGEQTIAIASGSSFWYGQCVCWSTLDRNAVCVGCVCTFIHTYHIISHRPWPIHSIQITTETHYCFQIFVKMSFTNVSPALTGCLQNGDRHNWSRLLQAECLSYHPTFSVSSVYEDFNELLW